MNRARFGISFAGLLFAAIQQGPMLGTSGYPRPVTIPAPVPSPPNVIIYLVDTLRADHLGCYGYPSPISPTIDGFAEDATLFERTVAQSS